MEDERDEDADKFARMDRTIRTQTTLIGVLFGLLIRSGTVSRTQVSSELEKVIASSDAEEAAILTMLQSKLVTRN